MKYKANLHEHDQEYHYHYSHGRDIVIEVDSWAEAVDLCEEKNNDRFTYTINFLMCNSTGMVYHTEKDMENAA